METLHNNKRRIAFNITVFSVAVMFLLMLCCNVSLAYLGGSDSGSDGNMVIANLNVGVTYTLNFGDTLLPNTTYVDTTKYKLTIKNTGNNGTIYLKVKFNTNIGDAIRPILNEPALWDNSGTDNNVYYYLSTLSANATKDFLKGFITANAFDNSVRGAQVDIGFTVYAIQAQNGAVLEDYSWTAEAPSAFKTLVGYTG